MNSISMWHLRLCFFIAISALFCTATFAQTLAGAMKSTAPLSASAEAIYRDASRACYRFARYSMRPMRTAVNPGFT